MNQQHLWPSHNAALLCVPSILYLSGGATARAASANKLPPNLPWAVAVFASSTSLLFALACCADALLHVRFLGHQPQIDSLFQLSGFAFSFRFDAVTVCMVLLVTFLGWIITRYSQAYMAGDAKEPRYIGNLMGTLSAVSLLVVTNNLALFLAAWVLTSLALHGLLTLYPYRQAAVIVAHKKFLASRLGDLTLLCGLLLLASHARSLEIDEVVRRIADSHAVPTSIHVAALLLAVSAMIKCAQLPLHGWLIQVMESPTPVSALLHAGVVNLGGFMLIRLSAVLNTTPSARIILVVVGCLTAIIGALVMTTRISIKVHLAWSTCAQMGFMLMECGLGLYSLAFLHLLAHSLYKAHAFLGSGGTVEQAKRKRMMPHHPSGSGGGLIASTLFGILVAALGSVCWTSRLHRDATSIFAIIIVGIAIAGIFAAALAARSWTTAVLLCLSALGVSILYFGYEAAFQKLVPGTRPTPQPLAFTFVLFCFVLLYVMQSIVRVNPMGRFARALYPWFYAGLYMDELFTRATFRLWPARRSTTVRQGCDAMQTFILKGATRWPQ